MNWLSLSYYALWRIYLLFVMYIAPSFVPYLGFFSYGDTMKKYGLPDFLTGITNFDGIFYIRIAKNGYSLTEQAYFPIYPALIKLVDYVFNNPIVSGFCISVILGILIVKLWGKYLEGFIKKNNINFGYLLLFSYPTAYYFGVMYTEAIFLTLFLLTMLALRKQNAFWLFIFGLLIALTRVQGMFVLLPIGVMILSHYISGDLNKKLVFASLGPVVGLATYMSYLWSTLGDPLYFIHAQESFGAQRSSHFILLPQVFYRYIKIFITADFSFQYVVAIIEFIFMAIVCTLLLYETYNIIKKRMLLSERAGLLLFSWANVLVPALTGTLTAIPRYSLMSLSIFILLSEIKSTWMKWILVVVFFILQAVMLTYFTQGYYLT